MNSGSRNERAFGFEINFLVQAKRAKIKRFIKPGHKDNWKKDVAGLTL